MGFDLFFYYFLTFSKNGQADKRGITVQKKHPNFTDEMLHLQTLNDYIYWFHELILTE